MLSAEQVTALQPQISLFELRTEPDGSDVLLPMDQPMMTVIPLLADGRARGPQVSGVARVSAIECGVP